MLEHLKAMQNVKIIYDVGKEFGVRQRSLILHLCCVLYHLCPNFYTSENYFIICSRAFITSLDNVLPT